MIDVNYQRPIKQVMIERLRAATQDMVLREDDWWILRCAIIELDERLRAVDSTQSIIEAVVAIQRTLGLNPHGHHENVADRIAALESGKEGS